MKNVDTKHLRDRLEKATRRPWVAFGIEKFPESKDDVGTWQVISSGYSEEAPGVCGCDETWPLTQADAELIADLVNEAPALLDAVEERDELREQVEHARMMFAATLIALEGGSIEGYAPKSEEYAPTLRTAISLRTRVAALQAEVDACGQIIGQPPGATGGHAEIIEATIARHQKRGEQLEARVAELEAEVERARDENETLKSGLAVRDIICGALQEALGPERTLQSLGIDPSRAPRTIGEIKKGKVISWSELRAELASPAKEGG